MSEAPFPFAAAQSAREIEAEAAGLLERRDFGDADEAALEAWLSRSPAHRAAYWRLEAAWDHTRRLPALQTQMSEAAAVNAPRNWFLLTKIAAVFVVVAALGAAATLYFSAPRDRTYATGLGGHELVSFADGTRIELNTNTRLRARMTTAQRIVWLDRGEAYFEVKHDPTHPFIVIVGDHRITDLGTKFVVRRQPGRTKVALLEGSAEFSVANVRARTQSALLMPGDVATATPNSIAVTREPEQQLFRALSWRKGLLVFKHTKLADAVAEFNRYNSEKLVLADAGTGALTIGGTFSVHHLDDFTKLVQLVLGLHVKADGNEILISR
jgi:transmembrane sensor